MKVNKKQVKDRINLVSLVQEYGIKLTKQGKNYKGLCPLHPDKKTQSFVIYPETQSFFCFGCGQGGDCFDFVIKMDGINFKEALKKLAAKVDISILNTEKKAEGGGDYKSTLKTHATLQPTALTTCTIEDYVIAKKMDLNFIHAIGLKDCKYNKMPAIRIPYYGVNGIERAVRFRTALEKSNEIDNRFKWRKGSRPCLYGLWKLQEAIKKKFLILVEGESDCHTLWYHKLPAIGVPGASNWCEEWAEDLKDIAKIYIVIEPDQGGKTVLKWLQDSKIKDRVYLINLEEYETKDISELHILDSDKFLLRFRDVLDKAIPWAERARFEKEQRRKEEWIKCKDLALKDNILDEVVCTVEKMGLVGERQSVKLLYLILTSRFLDRPISTVIKGPSSGGKSFLLEKILKFFPENAYYILSAMSERALAYSNESLSQRFLIVYEACGLNSEFGSYLIRSLLSEGCIRYETVEKTSKGIKSKLIEKPGPTGFISTTTETSLHPENETRIFSLHVSDSKEQTKRIIRSLASDVVCYIDMNIWHSFQEWLSLGNCEVFIPYALKLAENIPPIAVRLRRDFKQLLTLIKSHALTHQANRKKDDKGRIIATLEDYHIVRELIVEILSDGLEAMVSDTIQQTVEVVKELLDAQTSIITIKLVAKKLNIDKSAAYRRIKSAISKGYLINEGKSRSAYDLKIGDPLPEEIEILPSVDKLREGINDCRDANCESDNINYHATLNNKTGNGFKEPLHGCIRKRGDAVPLPYSWIKRYNHEILERLSIMTVDGGLSDKEAERMLFNKTKSLIGQREVNGA